MQHVAYIMTVGEAEISVPLKIRFPTSLTVEIITT